MVTSWRVTITATLLFLVDDTGESDEVQAIAQCFVDTCSDRCIRGFYRRKRVAD